MNPLLEKAKTGRPVLGTFTHLKSPVAVEALGHSGLDYVLIDTEHCPAGIETVAACITAANAAGMVPLVRINEISRSAVLQPLDIGAQGLIVPAVDTVDEVRKLVRFAKFAPLGNRGFCPTRDGGWGFDSASRQGGTVYMDRCNHETLLIPQCETAGCLEHIEEITAMKGVDGIFVGPMDLSIALHCPMELDSPIMLQALQRILAACKAAGKFSIIYCGDPVSAKSRLQMGFDSITLGLDAIALLRAYQEMVQTILE